MYFLGLDIAKIRYFRDILKEFVYFCAKILPKGVKSM